MLPDHPPLLIPVAAAAVDLLAAAAYKQAQPTSAEVMRPISAALASGVLFCLPTAVWVRRRFVDNGAGEQAFPMVAGIFGFTAVAARYWDDLDAKQRICVATATAALVALMWFTSAHPVDGYHFLAEMSTVLLPIPLATGFGHRLSADSDGVWELLVRRSNDVISDAYRTGCDNELRLLIELVDEAALAISEVESALAIEDRDLIRQHFQEAREWLVEQSISSSSLKTDSGSPSY